MSHKEKSTKPAVVYSEAMIRSNAAVIDYIRTSFSTVSGATAGTLGLTGIKGFVFYFIMSMALSVMLYFKAGTNWNNYFLSKRSVWTDGVLSGLFTYVLFWTFLYGLVHVYWISNLVNAFQHWLLYYWVLLCLNTALYTWAAILCSELTW